MMLFIILAVISSFSATFNYFDGDMQKAQLFVLMAILSILLAIFFELREIKERVSLRR